VTRILILTSDHYAPLLKGFAHQWNQYCGLSATVVYHNVAPAPLPNNFTLLASPGEDRDWSGCLKRALDQVTDEIVIVGLDDHWLSAPADLETLIRAEAYLRANDDVQRIDLTEDRATFPYMERDGYLQAVFNPTKVEYPLSSQFSLWRRAFLQRVLREGETVHQFEVEASRAVLSEFPVILGIGTRVFPCPPSGVVWNGRLENLHLEGFTPEDAAELKARGYA